MKIKKTLSIAFLFAFLSTVIQAQVVLRYKDAIQMKNRQPVLMINAPDEDLIGKLTKKGWMDALQQYQKGIADYNAAMKDYATKFWTFNSMPILVKTKEEVKAMCKDKSTRDNLVIFYCYSELSLKHDFDWGVDKQGQELIGSRSIFAITFGIHENQIYETNMLVLIPTAEVLSTYFDRAADRFNEVISKGK